MKKNNIIFVFTDQQRWDSCGCYGQKLPITPHLDKMAKEGTIYKNAFSCQPVCGPARSSIQTGLYPAEIGCQTNNKPLPADKTTIADLMNKDGYETAYIGKWHLASSATESYHDVAIPVEKRGGYKDFWLASDILEFTSHGYGGCMFDTDMNKREFPEGRFRADVLTDWAIEYLNDRKTDNPFFLFLSYIEPHHQNDRRHYEGPHGSKEKFKDFETPGDLIGTEGDWQEEYPDYLGCVNSLDQNLGRIRAELDKIGIADDTVVIFASDHGSHFKTRNGEYKRSCHESSLHTPLVACGPGFNGGHVVEDLVSMIDYPPTLLEAAGIKTPAEMHGFPLQDMLNDEKSERPSDIIAQISESQCGRALRTKKWKYSVQAPGNDKIYCPHSNIYVEAFLYDLEADPHERNNLVLSPEHVEVRRKLRKRLLERIVESGDPKPEIMKIAPTIKA